MVLGAVLNSACEYNHKKGETIKGKKNTQRPKSIHSIFLSINTKTNT